MDTEIEQKDNKLQFLEDKVGIPDPKVVQELNRLDLNKVSSKVKSDRTVNKLNKTLKYHKYTKN